MGKRIEYQLNEIVGNHGCAYLYDVDQVNKNKRKAMFRCKCGNLFATSIFNVKSGYTKSCGCLRTIRMREVVETHGLSKHPLYKQWITMKARCYKPNSRAYKWYGKKGVSVYDEWKHDFQSFYDYIIKLPHYGEKGYTLDRIDNDGNYEPGNVRWANKHIQAANTSLGKNSSTHYVGVCKRTNRNMYSSYITVNYKQKTIGQYSNLQKAVEERDKYILNNKLWEYPLQSKKYKYLKINQHE